MAVENFTTVNRRIEEERRTKYCGTASIRITSLKYRDPAHDWVTGPKNNHVDAMKRMFRQERGCRKEDSRHHVKALIPQQALEAAVARASIPSSGLMTDNLPYAELEFPTGFKIECLEGHDRLAAADKVLQGFNERVPFIRHIGLVLLERVNCSLGPPPSELGIPFSSTTKVLATWSRNLDRDI
ncbi:hypothetical protein MAJ_09743, partial [Metarhizium majus ARSEF 297]